MSAFAEDDVEESLSSSMKEALCNLDEAKLRCLCTIVKDCTNLAFCYAAFDNFKVGVKTLPELKLCHEFIDRLLQPDIGIEGLKLTDTPVKSTHVAQEFKCPQAEVRVVFHEGKEKMSGVNQLIDAIATIRNEPLTYMRCLAMIQSTGTGKTQACVSLGRSHRCVFFPCQPSSSEASANFSAPPVLRDMIDHMHAVGTTVSSRERIASKIIHCLIECAQGYDTPEELFSAQMTPPYAFYAQLAALWENIKTTPVKKVRFASTEVSLNLNGSGEVEAATSESSGPAINFICASEKNLVVIFDEVVAFTSATMNPQNIDSPIRCLQRILNKTNLVAVFLSTSTKVAYMVPGHKDSRPLDLRHRIDHPPIYQIDFPDLFAGSLFEKGRPLWHSKLVEFKGDLNKLLDFAEDLLCHKSRICHSDDSATMRRIERKRLACSLFCIRISGYAPVRALVDDFVAHNLAIMTSIDITGAVGIEPRLSASYRSEPALVNASAHLTTTKNQDTTETHLTNVVSSINGESAIIEADAGDSGEVSVCAGLLCTMDRLRYMQHDRDGGYNPNDGRSMLCNIAADAFLCALDVEEKYAKRFDEFVVNFSHFKRLPKASKAHFEHAFERSCAVMLPANATGVDLVIMMKSTLTGKFGAMLIQCKNYRSEKLSKSAALGLLGCCTLPVFTHCGDDSFDSNAIVSVLACSGGLSFLKNIESVRKIQNIVHRCPYLMRNGNTKLHWIESFRFTITFHSMKILSEGVKNALWELACSRSCDRDMGMWNQYGSFGNPSLDADACPRRTMTDDVRIRSCSV